tara:strand:- start:1682 stop:2470 length:789 start_codon:yes stop_codon:yes gene_type:complete
VTYITEEMAVSAIRKMKSFNDELCSVFENHNLKFNENLGRRNGVLSHAQESFFADEIGKEYASVFVDGRTGQPDIYIGELEKELECKLTSGSGSQTSYSLQTDYNSLDKKGSLDHLYVLADADFNRFAVLLFESLCPDDFHPPANGSKGKSRMNKASAMKKCKVLWGSVELKNDREISKLQRKILENNLEKHKKINKVMKKILQDKKNMNKAVGILDRERVRFDKKSTKLREKISYWENATHSFSIRLAELPDTHIDDTDKK